MFLKKRKPIIYLWVALFTAVSLIIIIITFLNLSNWLIINDPLPNKADYLFTFSGERLRFDYSLILAQNYQNSKWIISGRNKDWYINHLIKKSGMDTARLIFIDSCESTWHEIEKLYNFLMNNLHNTLNSNKLSPRNIVLVSTPYHMKRIKLTINKIFKTKRVSFIYCPVPFSYYENESPVEITSHSWWTHSYLRQITLTELLKISFIFFTFNILSK